MTLDELIALDPELAQKLSLKMCQAKHSLFKEENAKFIESMAPPHDDAYSLYWRANPARKPVGDALRLTEANWIGINNWWNNMLSTQPKVLMLLVIYCWLEKEQARASVVQSLKALENQNAQLISENAHLRNSLAQQERDIQEVLQGVHELKQELLSKLNDGATDDKYGALTRIAIGALGGHLLAKWVTK